MDKMFPSKLSLVWVIASLSLSLFPISFPKGRIRMFRYERNGVKNLKDGVGSETEQDWICSGRIRGGEAKEWNKNVLYKLL